MTNHRLVCRCCFGGASLSLSTDLRAHLRRVFTSLQVRITVRPYPSRRMVDAADSVTKPRPPSVSIIIRVSRSAR